MVSKMYSHIFYNPDTGVFTTKESRGSLKAGDVMGYTAPGSYTQIRVGGVNHFEANESCDL
jgi:hypothetical protein